MKKDFVVNVSHELRTPLTAIKGFVETLDEDANDKNRHYIEIIRRHTDRLINIVQDLLTLSEIEERQTQLMLSKVDIRVLLENLTKIFEYKLAEKNLKLIVHVDEAFPKIKIDPFKMEQVFVNLIDNAIKYTDEGFIKISAFQMDDKAIIEIMDTVIGIPKEHHPRIFERFYTVDKSRSKKHGGTGLGLSIVKHIVLLHQGEIIVDTNPDGGTKFVISIPVKLKAKS
jgi:two-component system phosphate regulon sensor histidine kinase PhoR